MTRGVDAAVRPRARGERSRPRVAPRRRPFDVLLISTYELGRQPFGLASPAAWLKRQGVAVTCLDLAVEALDAGKVAGADLVAIYVPMHTASRIATEVARRVKQLNPRAHLCFYGLYAPVNEMFFRSLGAETIIGGEFEQGLVALVQRLSSGEPRGGQTEPVISLGRQQFLVPDRSQLPSLSKYAALLLPDGRQQTVGYTEASRGCKHTCRHCPIVPVYGGRFRIVQREVVLEDIRRQVDVGAQHITFGDPDFFNGPGHAIPLVQELHERFPQLTYDVTIKVEHLLVHAKHLPTLRDTGCLFVTTAVESADDRILAYFDKRHTVADFMEVVGLFQDSGLTLAPTFVSFTPWTTLDGYVDLLHLVDDLDLVPNVSPVQYAIRLLIPAGSKLLELPEVRDLVNDFDDAALCYPWEHSDPRVDTLYREVLDVVAESGTHSREETFRRILSVACRRCASAGLPPVTQRRKSTLPRAAIPHLNEPWYC